MAARGVRFSFGIMDSLAAQLAGVPTAMLHLDVDAMCAACDAVAPLADRLGVPRPVPHLAGLTYVHASTLGVPVHITPDAEEPWAEPCIHSPEDIDRLAEPADYLAAGLVPRRLALAAELKRRRPNASGSIGHDLEGPVTTAALMMGPSFFMLPYDDPERAHKLLAFCTRSSISYCRVLNARTGSSPDGGHVGFPDDFAGMLTPPLFREFVLPYWRTIFEEFKATRRSLHCELLHPEHMPFLEELRIDDYDPSVDQYLPAEALRQHCRVPYGLRIWPAWVQDKSAEELVAMYRRFAADQPRYIMFHLHRLEDEPKIAALLAVARDLANA
ncbi:MAG: uroporphyrinogen decarboxylase family protein [Phycisphaerae bacterium]|nr:uroporphyrinogen decarboxylase family protein [Phycisphaerae bacterium]